MTFLTSWVFWVIIVVIIIIMAIIGYLAEGTELDSKSKKNPKQEKTEPNKVEEITINEENSEPSAWTGEIKKDERHEQIHEVSSVDDWTAIPTDMPAEAPSQEITEEKKEELFSEMTPNSTVPNVEPINPQVLENIDAPLMGEPIETITEVSNETTEEPQMIDASSPVVENVTASEEKLVEPVVEVQAEQIINMQPTQEQLIEPAPIFNVPEPEQIQTVNQPTLETLEMPEEENKQETNAEDIWK